MHAATSSPFGCMQMLSGKRAFEAENPASVIAAILQREPAPLDVAPPLDRVIRTCLAKDPDQRFQNALDLKRAFTWAMEQPASVQPNRRAWLAAAIATLSSRSFRWLGRLPPATRAGRRSSPAAQYRPSVRRPLLRWWNACGGDPAISPDGRMAAFVALVNGKIGISVSFIGRHYRTASARDPGCPEQPIWSPDSRSVAFNAGNLLRRVNVDGGTAMDLNVVRTLRGASWGSDGYILFSQVDRSPLSSGYSIYRVSESGGTPSLVTAPQASHGELSFRWPQALPDGRFMYCLEAAGPEDSGAFAASLANPGDRVKLVGTESKVAYASGPDGQGYLLWMRGAVFLLGAGVESSYAALIRATAGDRRSQCCVARRDAYHRVGDRTVAVWNRRPDPTRLVGPERKTAQGSRRTGRWDSLFRLSPDERQIAVQRAPEKHKTFGYSMLIAASARA